MSLMLPLIPDYKRRMSQFDVAFSMPISAFGIDEDEKMHLRFNVHQLYLIIIFALSIIFKICYKYLSSISPGVEFRSYFKK